MDVLQHLDGELPRQWRHYRKRLQRCQQEFSPVAVHDARIATRRLLATLELLAAFVSEPELKPLRRALKKHLDAFDDLRDTQMQLRSVAPLRRSYSAAREFHAWLRLREVRFTRDARQAVKRIKTRPVGSNLAALAGELHRQRKSIPPRCAFTMASDAVGHAFARVNRFLRRVEATAPKTIHRTRIAFKRFRYMMEALSPLLPGVTDELRAAMRDYQSMMGDVQDLKVLLGTWDEFVEPMGSGPARQRLRAEFVRRRERLIRRYINSANNLKSFWPPKGLSPDPGIKKNKRR